MVIAAALVGSGMAWGGPLDPSTFDVIAESYSPPPGTVIDTDVPEFGVHRGEFVDGVAVFTFGSLVIDVDIPVTGSRPVALLTTGDLTIRGRVDVSASGESGGPGGTDASTDPGPPGVGLGEAGYAGGGGGHCGAGGAADFGEFEGGSVFGDLLGELSGGGGAGSSLEGAGNSVGGGGGGSLELGALGVLSIEANLLARGAAGRDRNNRPAGGGGAGGGVLLHGGAGSVCAARLRVDGGAGGASTTDHGGGGGGGGCVVALGLTVDECVFNVRGGDAGVDEQGPGGTTSAEPGIDATPFVEVDPDFDGDGFKLSDGDCNDLRASVNPGAKELAGDSVDSDCDGMLEPESPDPGDTGEPVLPEPTGDTGMPAGDTATPAPPPSPSPDAPPGYRLWSCDSGLGMAASSMFGVPLIVAALRRRRRGGRPR
ncbi:MAG: putative metal-binding motif-containing protein [Myxococcota bacterium]